MDCLESKTGLFQFLPEPAVITAYPGGLAVGADFQVVPGAAAGAGGAVAMGHATAVAVVADNGTISHNGRGVMLVSSAAAITGVIVQAGTVPGQELYIVNTNATDTITMAASGTSNVANGTGCVVSGVSAVGLVWNAISSLWEQMRAA